MSLIELQIRQHKMQRIIYFLKGALETAEEELKAIEKDIDEILYEEPTETKEQ